MKAPVRSMSDFKPCPDDAGTRQCVEWYGPGEARIVNVNGMEIVIRFVGRRGRRGRIAINAPAGAVVRAVVPPGADVAGGTPSFHACQMRDTAKA